MPAERDNSTESTDGAGASPRGAATPGTPAPQYGEYAPEGWSWSPEGSTPEGGAPKDAAPAAAATAARSGQLPGVPHNLGVDADPSNALGTPPAARPEQSYRATEPPKGGVTPRDGKLADRIMTILLLAVGAYFALSFAFSLQQLPQQLRLVGTMLGLENLTVSGTVGTVGMVGAIVVLAIYAVNLIFSIQRMRARKFAFWIPLVAFVLALIVVFVCTMIAVAQTPELLQQMSDPAAMERLLNSMTTPAP